MTIEKTRYDRTTMLSAAGVIAGPIIFTLAWFILGFLSPGYRVGGDWISPFDPIAQPISGLGMGETGPWMNAGFILGGLVTVAGLPGTVRAVVRSAGSAGELPRAGWVSVALLALSPLGLVVAGIFTLDTPAPHFLGFFLTAATPAVSFPVAGRYLRTLPGWRRFGTALLVAGPVTLVFLITYLLSFDRATVVANEGVAGLTSRLLGLAIHVWYIALGVRVLRRRAIG